jgi:hypothetical protein
MEYLYRQKQRKDGAVFHFNDTQHSIDLACLSKILINGSGPPSNTCLAH